MNIHLLVKGSVGAVLALGLAYAWVNGYLDWIKPDPQPTNYQSPVPRSYYDEHNRKFENRLRPKADSHPDNHRESTTDT